MADISLRARVSQEINERLMGEISTFADQTPLKDLLAPYVRGRTQQGRRVRALDISGKDRELLQAISDSVFTVSGITNAALRKKLCSTPWGAGRTDKQLSARVSRHLRLLRDHGFIRKLPNRHRYQLADDSGGHVEQLFGGRREHRIQCRGQLPASIRHLVPMTVG